MNIKVVFHNDTMPFYHNVLYVLKMHNNQTKKKANLHIMVNSSPYDVSFFIAYHVSLSLHRKWRMGHLSQALAKEH